MALLNLLDPLNLLGGILNPPAPAPAPAPAPTPTPAPAISYPNVIIEDFENIAGAVNDWNYVGLPKNWYTDNPSGIIEVGSQEAYGLVGEVGNKIVEIEAATGDFNLYTMVQTTAGTDVTISFDAAQRPGYTSKISVLVNGKEIGEIFPQSQILEPFTFTAQGTGQPMRIEFKSTNSNAFGVLMDNIQVLQPLQNNVPVASDDAASGKQNTDVVIATSTLLANDQDADGDTLTIFSVQDAVNGTVKIDGNNVIFTPNTGYSGPASFTYTAFDGKDGTSVATVNLAIEAVVVENQAPIAKNDAVSGFKNNEFVISPSTLLGNDVDPEGGAITGVGLGNAVNGNVYWDGTNVIFTPTAGYSGPASFTYTIADDKGVESTATVNLTIANNASATNVTNGTAAADSIIDTSGDDVISGLAGNDKIVATDGNDNISGGAGNDMMQGGAGADTFTWTLADTTAAGIEIDTLYADGNDKLNMKDLLVGEANTANALDNYLHFSFENGDTVISVDTKGTFADNNQTGVINNGTVDQKIVLAGFDLTAGNTLSDVQVIQNLLNGNHLITD